MEIFWILVFKLNQYISHSVNASRKKCTIIDNTSTLITGNHNEIHIGTLIIYYRYR